MRRSAWVPYLPGTVAFSVLYAWVATRTTFDYAAVNYLYQSLGTQALTEEPLTSLLVNHVQPPGLNALYAVILALPGQAELWLQAAFAVISLTTVLVIVKTLLVVGVSARISAASGLLFAFLPTTVLYAFFPYNTAIVGLLVASCMLGFALLTRGRRALGLAIYCTTVVGLFLTRPSFVWIAVIALLFFPAINTPRDRRRPLLIAAALATLPILFVQGYALTQFGSLTLSSWSGQNLVKGLTWSGVVTGDDVLAAADTDPCLASLATRLEFWGSAEGLDPSCYEAPSGPDRAALALDQSLKGDGINTQLNSRKQLQLAPAWNRLALQLLREHPTAIPEMVLGVGPGQTSFELLLEPGYRYRLLNDHLVAGTPFVSLFRPVGALYPAGALAITLFIGVLAYIRGWSSWRHRSLFLLGGILVGYSVIVGTVTEFGENQRFFSETYSALAVLVGLSASYVLRLPHDRPEMSTTRTK